MKQGAGLESATSYQKRLDKRNCLRTTAAALVNFFFLLLLLHTTVVPHYPVPGSIFFFFFFEGLKFLGFSDCYRRRGVSVAVRS